MIAGMLFTILTGIFFLIGIIILRTSKNNEKTSNFVFAVAFVVLIGLLAFDLLPELWQTNDRQLIIPAFLGFFILIVLDTLIPHHHHEHSENETNHHDHDLHLNHIGVITILTLAIHNMIEGISLYTVTLSGIKYGLLMMLATSLHNIPLGFQIGNSLKKKKNNSLLIFILCISSFLGSLIVILFGNLSEIITNNLLSLTFGMLLYILIFELFGEIWNNYHKKETIYGILIGIVILLITNLL